MNSTAKLFLGIFILLLTNSCSALKNSDNIAENLRVSWGVIENYHNEKSQNLSRFVIKNEGQQTFSSKNWKMYFNFFRPVVSSDTTLVRFRHVSGDFFEMSPAPSFPTIAPGDSVVIDFISRHYVINVSDAPGGIYFTFGDGNVSKPGAYTVRPFAKANHTLRNSNDKTPLATPGYIYNQNSHLTKLDRSTLVPITPKPVSYSREDGTIEISAGSHSLLYDEALDFEARHLKEKLQQSGVSLRTDSSKATGSSIELSLNPGLSKAESYILKVNRDGSVKVSGADKAGIFYGIQSLVSLIPVEAYDSRSASLPLPVVTVRDHPRFVHRGMFLDVSRNFQSKESIKKLLDLMAHYKLNRFHIHLADDEGWRIEIPGLPELTEVGARRGHTLDEENMLHPSYGSGPFVESAENHGTGYYSTDDFVEILRYASDRHIEIIPEIDVPGHARAAIKSMLARYHRHMKQGQEEAARQYLLTDLEDASVYSSVQNYDDNAINPCRSSTYAFMEKVVEEIQQTYRKANAPLTTFHIGGDEVPLGVWAKAPSCLEQFPGRDARQMKHDVYTFFVDSLSTIIQDKGLKVGGWEDIGVSSENGHHLPNKELADRDFVLNTWNSIWGGNAEDLAYRLANTGYEVVLSNATNLYFDMAIHKNPQEPGLYWAAFVNTKNVFEFTPMDIFKSAYVSSMGNTLDDSRWKDKVRLTSKGRKQIKGIQGQLWSETVKGQDRMEYMIFPRMLALAQRAWSPKPHFATISNRVQREKARDQAWNMFANVLGQYQLPKLDHFSGGVNYNLPTPGAVVEDGLLLANIEYPGLTIRYTTDGSEPDETSPAYTRPVRVKADVVKLKAFSRFGQSSRSVQVY